MNDCKSSNWCVGVIFVVVFLIVLFALLIFCFCCRGSSRRSRREANSMILPPLSRSNTYWNSGMNYGQQWPPCYDQRQPPQTVTPPNAPNPLQQLQPQLPPRKHQPAPAVHPSSGPVPLPQPPPPLPPPAHSKGSVNDHSNSQHTRNASGQTSAAVGSSSQPHQRSHSRAHKAQSTTHPPASRSSHHRGRSTSRAPRSRTAFQPPVTRPPPSHHTDSRKKSRRSPSN